MKKEASCINTYVILEYVKTHNNGDCSALIEDLHPEIDSLDDPVAFLTDQKNWVSVDIVVELFKRAKNIFQDDTIPYRIGKFAVEDSKFGRTHKLFVKAFWSFKKALKNVQKINIICSSLRFVSIELNSFP